MRPLALSSPLLFSLPPAIREGLNRSDAEQREGENPYEYTPAYQAPELRHLKVHMYVPNVCNYSVGWRSGRELM